MDWSKVDAALAGALAEGAAADRYVVFVHLDPAADLKPPAERPGAPAGDGPVRTATVSAAEVDQLSERADVRHLRLSRTLDLQGPT